MGMTEAEVISTFSASRMEFHHLRTEGRDLYRDAELVFSRMGDNGGSFVVQCAAEALIFSPFPLA
jgi:hypothetical protein